MIKTWLADVYNKYGYVAVLVAIVVLVALVLTISYMTGYDVAGIVDWLGAQ